MKNKLTTQILYDKLLQMSDLHSIPKLEDTTLIWELYNQAYIRAYCEGHDTCIEIVSKSRLFSSMHWHPDEDDMFNELYSLEKKGNILVLKHFLIGTGVFYIGNPTKYHFSKNGIGVE